MARELLGQHLHHGEILVRITEVEAYGGAEDSASHARHGRTPRNAPMWEEGGRAYIYFCYGMHHMLNLVTGPAGEAAAVLIRACEPVAGLREIQARRGVQEGPELLAGPGRVAQALALDRTFNHHALFEAGGLEACKGEPPARILMGPRVGIDFASPEDRAALRRFALADSQWVTRRRELQ